MKRSIVLVPILWVLVACALPAWAKPEFGGLNADELVRPEEVTAMMESKKRLLIFDARSKRSYDESHVRGALLPLGMDYYRQEELFRTAKLRTPPDVEKALAAHMKRYPKDAQIITYCSDACQASAVLTLRLKRMGFTNVRAMHPAFETWRQKGYPVEGVSAAVPVTPCDTCAE